MSNRERVVQQDPPGDLSGFPELVHTAPVYRAARFGPWWFCNDGCCRFDLDVASGAGTLYAGTDEITGVLETIGAELVGGVINRRFLSERTVFALNVDPPATLANLTGDAAVGFGVTNELSTMTPYDVPQRWAGAFHRAGFAGIRYRTRFNTGEGTTGVALFGPSGAGPTRPAVPVRAADDVAIVEHLAERRIDVEDPPSLRAMTVL